LAAYPKDYLTQRSLALACAQAGRTEEALAAARAARALAPERDRPALDQLIAQLQAGQGEP
ncbi:MAG TPA: hypothetical protein PLB78_15270, partial [Anaerolineae bacterium]|nr:hypothetical protein [Anaerolineae bacterium]